MHKNLPLSDVEFSTLTINYNGMCLSGNDKKILLEQLEQQNISVPYSCRSGLCGRCKITLLKGEVTALKKGACDKQGQILSCSCIPKNDITLSASVDVYGSSRVDYSG